MRTTGVIYKTISIFCYSDLQSALSNAKSVWFVTKTIVKKKKSQNVKDIKIKKTGENDQKHFLYLNTICWIG